MQLKIDVWFPREVEILAHAMREILHLRATEEALDFAKQDVVAAERTGDALAEIPAEDVTPLVALYVKKYSVEDLKTLLRSEFNVVRVTQVPSDKTAQLIGKLKEGLA